MAHSSDSSRAMVLVAPKTPLLLQSRAAPEPGREQLRVRVRACAVCRTDLHVIDDELPHVPHPIIPGHEIVGVVDALGEGVSDPPLGARVGIPWLAFACGSCPFCLRGEENLCLNARFTGYQVDGGYAEHVIANARFVLRIPERYSDTEAAPLLCAGLIGYRTLRLAGEAEAIGIYGFGAAAHLVAQAARAEGRRVFAFTRPGDEAAQAFARSLGAEWAGGSDQRAPVELDAALIFAPVGALVPVALAAVRRGGSVVCGGIHMSDLPSFPYSLLWGERVLRSVANLTREDGRAFLALAAKHEFETHVTPYPLERANDALEDLRHGRFTGAAVLVP